MERWNKEVIESIISESNTQKEVLIKLGLRSAGSNFKTLKKYIELYKISTSHFKKSYDVMVNFAKLNKIPICEVLIENSSYSRAELKKRLYSEKILYPICCLCGQDENWNGMKISLILDHINGIHNDNRIENLRIVCPNCNAGLDTFAGKNTKRIKKINFCGCGNRIDKAAEKCIKCQSFQRRKVERPSYEILKAEVESYGYSSIGRKYGVSDNCIRKWIKYYEKEL